MGGTAGISIPCAERAGRTPGLGLRAVLDLGATGLGEGFAGVGIGAGSSASDMYVSMSTSSLPLSLSLADPSLSLSPSPFPLPLDKVLAYFLAFSLLFILFAAFLSLSSSGGALLLLSLDLPFGVALVRACWWTKSIPTHIDRQHAARVAIGVRSVGHKSERQRVSTSDNCCYAHGSSATTIHADKRNDKKRPCVNANCFSHGPYRMD